MVEKHEKAKNRDLLGFLEISGNCMVEKYTIVDLELPLF